VLVSRASRPDPLGGGSRTIDQLLALGTVHEVLFERVLAGRVGAAGRDGRLVHHGRDSCAGGGGFGVGHSGDDGAARLASCANVGGGCGGTLAWLCATVTSRVAARPEAIARVDCKCQRGGRGRIAWTDGGRLRVCVVYGNRLMMGCGAGVGRRGGGKEGERRGRGQQGLLL